MSHRKANELILIATAFLLCACIVFLLYQQKFFHEVFQAPSPGNISVENIPVFSTSSVSSSPLKNSNKVLKSFGSCGDESKNNIILNYPVDLLNALLDNVQGSHCESPKPGFPNYSFILQDPSIVRIAEMTPDYKYIFYLEVQTTDTSSTYYLYKTDILSRRTALLDTYTISSDWPLQKDFYEDKLMPRQSPDGITLEYFWFIQDPKGRVDTTQYLEKKIF